jgi:hypothetical protein
MHNAANEENIIRDNIDTYTNLLFGSKFESKHNLIVCLFVFSFI